MHWACLLIFPVLWYSFAVDLHHVALGKPPFRDLVGSINTVVVKGGNLNIWFKRGNNKKKIKRKLI